MSRQLEKEVKLYDGKVYGHRVSNYGLDNGYLDYYTLSEIVGDCVLNNNILQETGYENWDLVSGFEGEYEEVYQYYIITYHGYKILEELTDEIVYYNEKLDMYVWGITHFGTSWDYVLTDIKLI